jgi:Tol biopolymer transport system component/predicted Ser/Thr protein kinase
MQAERWKQIQDLCQAALDQPPERRAAFLAQACPDPQLRAEVQSLLDQQADSFLESAPVSAVRALSPGTKLGNFEIVELLGRGGMGEVYRARDPRLKREVAIKVLPAGLARDPDRIARFEREARAASALNHPNIVSVYDIGRDNGTHWIASELVRGDTLRRLIESGPLPSSKAIEIATQVAIGLAAAHAAGLVHRDLKPDNIMVTRDGHVKILDFGLAKQRRTSPDSTTAYLTDAGTVLGTAGYMSPEQVRGDAVDHRADLFSFGVVLYEMLCGKRAFAGNSSVEVMNAILKEEAPELPPSVPPALGRIVRRCLEKEPAHRFQSAADLAFALQPSSPSLPVLEAPKRRTLPTWVGLAASFAVLGAAWFWLSRPLPPPRVTGTVQITNDGRGNGAPMLTDGTRLLFNLTDEPRQVSVKGGQPVPLLLPMQNAVLADISPDRTEFLMYRRLDAEGALTWRDSFTLERLEFWVAPLVGGSPRRLGDLIATHRDWLNSGTGFPTPRRYGEWPEQQSAAAWSPDGQQLVYARDMELHLARSDGTEIRKLATFAGYPFFVRWSPDGRRLRLSVSGTGDTAASLWEISVDDGHVRPVLPGWDPSWYNCCGSWTADGKYFVFQSRSNVWAMREKAGFLRRAAQQPVQLTTGPMAAYWPLPSRDGKRLFIAGYLARNEFLRYDLQSHQFVPELAGVSGDQLEFSSDGKWVAYVSIPEGSLVRAAADGSQRLQLTSSPLAPGMPHWSPDGKQIAFLGGTPGKPPRVYVVSADGGPVRQVTNGESGKNGDLDPSWSPDGASLAFGATDKEQARDESMHVVDLKTNHVSALAGSEGMWSPRWSPDGRFIAGLSGSVVNKLMLYDLQTRQQTQLFNLPGGCPTWSRDGESLFFGDEHWWVWRIWVRGRKAERVMDLHKIRVAGWGWFATTPDNALITARDAGSDEIYALDWEAP